VSEEDLRKIGWGKEASSEEGDYFIKGVKSIILNGKKKEKKHERVDAPCSFRKSRKNDNLSTVGEGWGGLGPLEGSTKGKPREAAVVWKEKSRKGDSLRKNLGKK